MESSFFSYVDGVPYLVSSQLLNEKISDSEKLKVLEQMFTEVKNYLGPSVLKQIVDGTKAVSDMVAEISDISFKTAISMIDTVTGGFGSLVPNVGSMLTSSIEQVTEYLTDMAVVGPELISNALDSISEVLNSVNKKTSKILPWLLIGGGGAVAVFFGVKLFSRKKERKNV